MAQVGETDAARHTAAETELWQQRFLGLVTLVTSIDWTFDQEEVYRSIAQTLTVVFDCDMASVYRLSVDGRWLEGYRARDVPNGQIFDDNFQLIRSSDIGMRTYGRTLRPTVYDVDDSAADEAPEWMVSAGYHNVATVPMMADDQYIGEYNILFTAHRTWDDEFLEYLCTVGRVLGSLIRNNTEAQKAAELQVLNECRRLSAEVHDNIAQTISTLKLGVESIAMSYEDGDYSTVGRKLDKQELIASQALASVREEMLALRDPVNESEDFVEGVRTILARIEENWKIATALETEGLEVPMNVSMQTQLQLMRILHESLTNVLQHASASLVRVVLEGSGRRLSACVVDDGCGFDLDAVAPERLGIRIMRERAASIGGQLTILSKKGAGTTVRVDIPHLI